MAPALVTLCTLSAWGALPHADGIERMHRIRPNDTWKTHRDLELGVNSRGIHFFSGRWAPAPAGSLRGQ